MAESPQIKKKKNNDCGIGQTAKKEALQSICQTHLTGSQLLIK